MIEALKRRPRGLLLLIILVAIVVRLPTQLQSGEETPRAELEARLARGSDPVRFSFSYERGGTRVLDCVLANRRFAGDVDVGADHAMFRRSEPSATPVAVVEGETVLLHRSLFADAPFLTGWLRLVPPVDPVTADALRRAVGADLAGYVLAPQMPATGRAVALAAVEIATTVTRAAPAMIDGRPADGFRISVDPERFKAESSSPAEGQATTITSGDPDIVPVFDVWLDERDEVLRLAVHSQRSDGTLGPAEDGWVVDYRPIPAVERPAIPPGDITEAASMEAPRLAAAPSDCRIGG